MTEPKWWDATWSREIAEKIGIDTPGVVGRFLMRHGAERCVIGDEIGEGGYRHFQIRVVFKKPTSFEQVTALGLETAHWSPTMVRDFNYVMKEGKFWCSWESALEPYQDTDITIGWYGKVINHIKNQGKRMITVVVDTNGNSGKTDLAKSLVAKHMGAYCPAMDESKDYMAWALAHQQAKCFIIDLPKSDSTGRNKAMWSAVEQMKNGYLWDKRNHWQEAWIETPQILIFTNEEPDQSLLSKDRWDILHLIHLGNQAYLQEEE